MRLRDVLAINQFPAVVSGADVAFCRSHPQSPETRDFLSGYLGFDARSQHALHSTLASLTKNESGGAFWLNGVFGSGKSHLLGILALLGEGVGSEIFAESHPDCAPYLERFKPRLTLHISLDEFDASLIGLEEIFWRELEREFKRRDLGALNTQRSGSRVENFVDLESELKGHGLNGLVICFDELSLYLGSRAHDALQRDAAFLQFLGGQSRRAPLWIFAALQKTIDDISGLESYSLSQIRDRFTLLPLSLAHLPTLVKQRIVRVADEQKVEEICSSTWEEISTQLPRVDFGPEDWRNNFPFHPATLSMLEAVTGRFFSRTRSAAIFCTQAIDVESEANARVQVDSIWDYFQPELEAHPDLRPLNTVWSTWLEGLDETFNEKDRANGLRVMRYLLLAKIAGFPPTPIQLANALSLESDSEGEANYEYARFLLERLRSKGTYLAVERGEDSLQDRYTIDLGRRIGEMARRQIAAALETISIGDSRIVAYLQKSCRIEPLPLAEFVEPRSTTVFWQHAPRKLSVEVWDGSAPERIANRVNQVLETGSPEDAVLAISPPFGQGSGIEKAVSLLEERARAALWLWKPRQPAKDEWDLAREALAAAVAASDPSLADNKRGRSLIEYLNKEKPAREAQLAKVALRLLLEGEVIIGNGAYLEAAELAKGDNFQALLEAIGEFGWPQLFPQFTQIAPRARLLTPSNSDTLCLEILRRPMAEPFFAASLERLARHLGEPLGVARNSAGRWKITEGKPALTQEILAFIGTSAPFSALEAHFAKSQWGLSSEQTAIVVCALLRGGELGAYDGRNQELEPDRIGLPLRRSVHYLRSGRKLEEAEWNRVAVLLREQCSLTLGRQSFQEAHKAAAALVEWREATEQNAGLASARAAQLRRTLGHDQSEWPQFEASSAAINTVLQTVPPRGAAFDILQRTASLDFNALREHIRSFQLFEKQLEQSNSAIIAGFNLLTHPDLVTSAELSEERSSLLERLAQGEKILQDLELVSDCRDFTTRYMEEYASWHNAQNDQARWNGWRRLANSEAVRSLERLSTLRNRSFGAEIQNQIDEELRNRCPRDGSLLPGESVCSTCGLRLGQRLVVRDKNELEAVVEQQIAQLNAAVKDGARQTYLQRGNSPFAEWDGEAESLLPLLSSANLQQLDAAFEPRQKVQRSMAQLQTSLKNCSTRGEMEASFKLWLDGDDALATDDEIELIS